MPKCEQINSITIQKRKADEYRISVGMCEKVPDLLKWNYQQLFHNKVILKKKVSSWGWNKVAFEMEKAQICQVMQVKTKGL